MIHVAVALIRDQNLRWLCCQRGANEDHAGYWEFPGGKFEANETLNQAIIREIREELDIDLSNRHIDHYKQLDWQHPGKPVRLIAGLVLLDAEIVPKLAVHQHYQWLATSQLRKLNWLESNVPLVAAIERDYR